MRIPWLVFGVVGVAGAAACLAGCTRQRAPVQQPGGGTAPVAVSSSSNHRHAHAPPLTEEQQLRQRLADAQYHADLGQVHLTHRRPAAAVQAYGRAVEIGGTDAENAFHIWGLGRAHQANGDKEQWAANLQRAAALFTRFAANKERAQLKDHYCEQLATIYGELGDVVKAVEWVDQLGSEGTPDSPTLRVKARLYLQHGLGAKALAVLQADEQRAAPGMDQERASYTVAETLVSMRRYPEAEARLKLLATSATETGLRKQAKRLLFKMYDETGRLDELDLDRSGKQGNGEGSR